MVADVLFSTNDSSPYDLAVVQLRESFAGASVPQMATSFTPGFVTFLVSQRPLEVSVFNQLLNKDTSPECRRAHRCGGIRRDRSTLRSIPDLWRPLKSYQPGRQAGHASNYLCSTSRDQWGRRGAQTHREAPW